MSEAQFMYRTRRTSSPEAVAMVNRWLFSVPTRDEVIRSTTVARTQIARRANRRAHGQRKSGERKRACTDSNHRATD